MTAPQPILDLVERFDRNLDAYHSGRYKEAQLRIEFLNPLFEILGWDMANRQGYTEAYKEVVHEDAILVGSATKAPDYSFRIGGTRKFFVEAKKPSIRIAGDPGAAFQLRRYAWSAKLPLSILTDFEEFAVYDCRVRPVKTDKPTTARVNYIRYTDFPDKWDEVAGVFAKDAILKGSFDRYIGLKKVKGTAEVDVAFLAEIERWRDVLARNLALRNPDLSVSALNYAVQTIIDRIIFLRICEDRGIEPYGRLRSAADGSGVYSELVEMFRQADSRYNSGLFYFRSEKGRPDEPDTFTPGLAADDKLLKDIIGNLYYPDSPYEFSVLPVEILGQVYEQFLGKVIRLTAGHQAKVEDKPEVKKAGGVYYTPTYIVEYIVKQTVGKLCEDRTPDQVSRLRILDPACGSGSFLLGAYQYLLNWHRDYYTAHTPAKYAKGKAPELRQVGNDWQLTTAERKRILLNNIYGVDIDHQAVEVTKLSLLLKVLEGENGQTLATQLQLFQERALPDMGSNIKCGNSLIGPDYAAGQLLPDPDEIARVNPFDWQAGFPDAMRAGGFDAVIGNPPYRSLLLGKKQESEDAKIVRYYERVYPHAAQYKMNLFGLFIECCSQLVASGGLFSFIVPNLFFTSHHFKDLRQFLLEHGGFTRVLDLRYKVFGRAEVGGNGIFVFTPQGSKQTTVAVADSVLECDQPKELVVDHSAFMADPGFSLMFDSGARSIATRIDQVPCVELGSICTIYQGIITGDNKRFLSVDPSGKKWEKILRGRDIDRYRLTFGGVYVLYDPEQLWSNTKITMFQVPGKLVSRQTSDHLAAVLDTEGYFTLDSTHVIHLEQSLFSLKYLLGLYNSRLLNFLYTERVREKGRAFAQVKVVNLRPLPIRTIDFSSPADVARHDQMVQLVERMLDLHKRLAAAKSPHDKTQLQRQIEATDKQIDALVYELYGLTDEEIRIVEGGESAV